MTDWWGRQKQLDYLADWLGCKLEQLPGAPGMMYVEFGYVVGPTLDGHGSPYPDAQSAYMTNLHELGHFALGHTQGRPPHEDKRFYFDNGVLKSEAQAWEWALDHAEEELSQITREFMWGTCLGSYYQGSRFANGSYSRLMNGNRHHVQFKYDEPDNYFWSIKARILGE